MSKIFCISAGQLDTKKNNSIFSKKHRYLNYGLLKLASILGRHNYSPIVIHGLFDMPEDTLEICKQLQIENDNTPLLLSIPSFFALEWARRFVKIIKKSLPNKKIIVGGRWVVGNNEEWFKSYLNVDLVVAGLADTKIVDIVDSITNFNRVAHNHFTQKDNLSVIDYEYLYERHLFQPSIEVSTGCGMGCSFCEERDIVLSKLKSASITAQEMKSLVINDNLVEISPYLEASLFVATQKWAEDLSEERRRKGVLCKWRVESRVDKLKFKNIHALAKAGLKVIDLGLESASLKQLKRMKKSNDPVSYLAAAKELIQTAYDNNIWVKLNILLYPGENSETIAETVNWLSNIKKYLKGVSIGPVIVYGINDDAKYFLQELSTYGASPVKSSTIGVTHLNLSKEIDFQKSLALSKEISREFMTAKDFFDLKSFSYFARDYKYSDFLEDITFANQEDVSFKL